MPCAPLINESLQPFYNPGTRRIHARRWPRWLKGNIDKKLQTPSVCRYHRSLMLHRRLTNERKDRELLAQFILKVPRQRFVSQRWTSTAVNPFCLDRESCEVRGRALDGSTESVYWTILSVWGRFLPAAPPPRYKQPLCSPCSPHRPIYRDRL